MEVPVDCRSAQCAVVVALFILSTTVVVNIRSVPRELGESATCQGMALEILRSALYRAASICAVTVEPNTTDRGAVAAELRVALEQLAAIADAASAIIARDGHKVMELDALAGAAATALAAAWRAMHTGPWRQTPRRAREVYITAALFAAGIDAVMHKQAAALRTLDIALMLAVPDDRGVLHAAVAAVGNAGESTDAAWRALKVLPSTTQPTNVAACQCSVQRFTRPSLQTFYTACVFQGNPAIISGAMSDWPALERWNVPEYLARVAGARTVPVEEGSHYMASNWSTKLCTLREFIDHIEVQSRRADGAVAGNAALAAPYLAQHALFDQIPELLADIRIPDYTVLGTSEDESSIEPAIKAWYGPAGTVTCLHMDRTRNLLAQVVGTKRVRLFPPGAGPWLYPHAGTMANTSTVDPEMPPPPSVAPRFASDAAPLEVVVDLCPGEMLFIPPGWWHHVRSLSVSFSVSFWW